MERTSLQLYRDCLRLIKHIAPGKSPKSTALHFTVRGEFNKHRDTTDEQVLEGAKAAAVRALSNYMLQSAVPNDPKVNQAAKDFQRRAVQEAKDEQKEQERANNANNK